MKKAFLVLVFLAVCGNAFAAELLIQAKPHWMDSLTKKEVLAMDESTRQSYEARSKVGDVIAVRPDGWAWGKEEGLPNYVVVKVPMTVEEAQKYEEQLTETVQSEILVDGKPEIVTTQVLKRKRKYAIPEVYVSTAKTADKTDVSIASKDVTAFKSAITEKVGLAKEIKPPVKDTIKTDLQSFYKKHLQKYVSVARTFWVENAWAATQLKKTVCPSGCDYTALETCMNANEQNLVTADKYFDVEISGTWSSDDTTTVTVHNYTTDSTRYINIYTTGDARHSGVWKSDGHRLYSNDYSGGGMGVYSPHVTIDGLQFYVRNTFNYNDAGGIFHTIGGGSGNATPCYIKNNLFKSNRTSTNANPIISFQIQDTHTQKIYFYNNIVYEIGNAVSTGLRSSVNSEVYNNTFYGFNKNVDFSGDQSNITKNNISQNSNTNDYLGLDTTSNNIDEDGSGEITATLTFVDVTNKNFHLASTDTSAIDAGVDLSGTFTTDIDGTTRSGTWDIGADEYVSASRRRNMLIQ